MKKNILYLVVMLLLVTAAGCSKDDMADVNTNPTAVSSPDLRYLFSQVQITNDFFGYIQWFYDYDAYCFPWIQLTVGQEGAANSNDFNLQNAKDGHWDGFYDRLAYASRLWNLIDNMEGETQASYQKIKYASYVLVIFQGMLATSMYGSMPYKEACQAQYSNPPILTPTFDTQEELYTQWADQLEKAFQVLNGDVSYNGSTVAQIDLSTQDLTYGGNWSEWAKFCNTVRLKLASNIYNANPTKAIQIANAVYQSGVYMKTLDDDYVYQKGTQEYGPGGMWDGLGAENFVTFLRENKDPRLFYLFEKNKFTTSVVQAYLNEGKPIPEVMKPYINVSADGKSFTWTADGELWGRYQGVTARITSDLSDSMRDKYFRANNFNLPKFATTTVFTPYSYRNIHLIGSNEDYQYYDISSESSGQLYSVYKPGGAYPRKQRDCTSAETYYLLTEFKLLGANISEDANSLFHTAITLSCKMMDQQANDMHIPYYDLSDQHDPNAISVALKDEYITDLLKRPAYNLTGDKALDLEKLYDNMLINYFPTGTNAYNIARKAGVPKTGSTIGWSREPFSTKEAVPIPRRFNITTPETSNINYDNMMSAYKAAGLTTNAGSSPATLESERLWFDKNSPAWGAGPKY